MKARINKSAVMKKAWRIFRMEKNSRFGKDYLFSYALSRAWRIEGREMAMKSQPKKVTRMVDTCTYGYAIINSYSSSRPGTYVGD